MRRIPSLTEGFGFAGLSFGVSVAIGIASSIVIARLYGIEVIGEFALVAAPVASLWYLSTIREQPAFIRIIANVSPGDGAVTGLFVAVFAFSSALTLVAVVLVTGVTYLLYDGPVDQPELFVPALANMAGYFLFTNPAWNLDSVFMAYGDGRRLFWIRGHELVAFLLIAVGLSFVLPTVWGPLLATIGSSVTALLHRVVAVGAWMRRWTSRDEVLAGFRRLPEIIKFGLKLAPGTIASGLTAGSTTWVLGSLTSVATVGAYSRASKISTRLGDVNSRMREMLFPALVRRLEAGDHEAFTRALLDSIRYSMVGLLLPAAVLGGASVSVMGLFGSDFEFAAPALAISMLAPALLGGNAMRTAAVTAIGRPLTITFARITALFVKLAVLVPLVLAWGIIGAAIAGLIRVFIVNVWFNVVIHKHLGISPSQLYPPRQSASVAAAYGAGFGAAAVLQDVAVQPLGLIVALLGGTAAYLAVYLAIGGPTERDRQRFQAVVTRLRRRLRPSPTPSPIEPVPLSASGEAPPPAAGGARDAERVGSRP